MANLTTMPKASNKSAEEGSLDAVEAVEFPQAPSKPTNLDTLSKSLALAEVHERDITSAERGMAAYLQSTQLTQQNRDRALDQILIERDTETHRRLHKVVTQSANSMYILSVIGYDRLRQLHASGALYADIAEDLQVNINDLMAFMRQHPGAADDAKADAETCADSQTAALMREISNLQHPTDQQVNMIKVKSGLQVELNKRLSGRWALREDTIPQDGPKASEFNIHIHNQRAQSLPPGSGPSGRAARVIDQPVAPGEMDDSGRDIAHGQDKVASTTMENGAFSMKIGGTPTEPAPEVPDSE